MVILGIDPGTAITGYGLLEVKDHKITHLAHGVLLTDKNLPTPNRMLSLYTQLNDLLSQWHPDVLVTEKLFFANNVNTALAVGGSIGVVLLAAAQRAIPWIEYRPVEVKMAVVGYGRAEKKQIQYMITKLLALPNPPTPDDAADALAIALCHAHSAPLRKAQNLS
ncbi:crossover junction endodeoxyribonuclease RuvC [Chthonomonas calidirosea]|uniref:crossover junction endodeoxyribonuclease RuvC n=1 Tax=Chthonomonas calidirosea TaxID=454171 RepID=UPI0006EC9489|nr:crossover junction endodeoxyribonuclease RuvC [Chthonomonas calidirosea]CEK14958.1 Holliday junction endonuclease RuvC [Chthonomonas calidirosea]